MTESDSLVCRQARLSEIPRIQQIINAFANSGEMLPRALGELYENARDFIVCEIDGAVVGCVALHVVWDNLAEIKSLAVDPAAQHRGAGTILAQQALDEARRLGVPSVFALTYRPTFFERLGFVRVDKHDLPQKIWSECIRCPKFPDCGEQALVLDLTKDAAEVEKIHR